MGNLFNVDFLTNSKLKYRSEVLFWQQGRIKRMKVSQLICSITKDFCMYVFHIYAVLLNLQ